MASLIHTKYMTLHRCGDALKQFFDSAPVQHYINGTSIKELRGDKAIHQPGTLREVNAYLSVVIVLCYTDILQKKTSTFTLGDVVVCLKTGSVKLSSLVKKADIHFPAELMNLEAKVYVFQAVVSQNRKLLTVGSTVRIHCIRESNVCRANNTPLQWVQSYSIFL